MLEELLQRLDEEYRKANNEAYRKIHAHIEPMLYYADEATIKNIQDKKLSYAGALQKMKNAAQKIAVKGVACISDAEGLAICEEYFGLKKQAKKPEPKIKSLFDLM